MNNKDLFWIPISVLGVIFGLFFCFGSMIQYYVDNVQLQVILDGKEVYHGRSACVDTSSIGSSSRVDTKTGPWCILPKQYFAGQHLEIKTVTQ